MCGKNRSFYIHFNIYADYEYYDKVGKLCVGVIVMTLIFGIGTGVSWFFARPTSTVSFAWICRIVLFVCILGQLILLGVADGYTNNTPQDRYYHLEPTDKEREDFQEWLLDKHPPPPYDPDTEEPDFSQSFSYWVNNISDKAGYLPYKFTVFLDIDLFFDSIVLVYWLGYFYFSWFENAGSSQYQSPQDHSANTSALDHEEPQQQQTQDEPPQQDQQDQEPPKKSSSSSSSSSDHPHEEA